MNHSKLKMKEITDYMHSKELCIGPWFVVGYIQQHFENNSMLTEEEFVKALEDWKEVNG